jgi:hypothetical protein
LRLLTLIDEFTQECLAIVVARQYGYRHSSGVTQLVKRLEAEAREDRNLGRTLAQLRSDLSNVKR